MDKLEKEYKIKQFFFALFRESIGEGNNLKDGQYIKLFLANKDNHIERYFSNIDELVKTCVSGVISKYNCYFSINTNNGISNESQNLLKGHMIGLDFDKKELGEDFKIQDIINKFRNLNIFYNCIVDTGHGYHVYILIEPTEDLKSLNKLTKELAEKLGADKNATLTTQLLRVPYTLNIKNPDKIKPVNLVYMDKEPKYRTLEYYSKRICDKQNGSINRLEYTFKEVLPKCLESILNGSREGERNRDLQRIVISLRKRNKSLDYILEVVEDWNKLNEPQLSIKELKYQTKYIYENMKYTKFDCASCEFKNDCFNAKKVQNCTENSNIKDDYLEEDLIVMPEKHMRYLKKSTRKGVKNMNGNMLVIYSLLNRYTEGLYKSELEELLAYEIRCTDKEKTVITGNFMNSATLVKTLQELEENDFIEVATIDRKKFYKLKEVKSKPEYTYFISMGATFECIKGFISTDELRLYNYLKYLYNMELRKDPKKANDRIIRINQEELAKDLGVTQGRISQMIDSLRRDKILTSTYNQVKNTGLEYCTYFLNY